MDHIVEGPWMKQAPTPRLLPATPATRPPPATHPVQVTDHYKMRLQAILLTQQTHQRIQPQKAEKRWRLIRSHSSS